MNSLNRVVSFALLLTVLCSPASAFKLSPEGTDEERKLSGIDRSWWRSAEVRGANLFLNHFNEPVHEEITNRIYGCEGGSDLCGGMRVTRAPAPVLAGVRWNDDPPFRVNPNVAKSTCKSSQTIRFQTQPLCWLFLFRDAHTRALAGDQMDAKSGVALLYRTHFGDLQFLHAMGAYEGEPAERTRQNVLDWAKFTWSVAIGEVKIGTLLNTVEIPAIQESFGYTAWSVQDLWTLGSPGLRRHIRDVAFGSLLHLVQDSFADGHVERASSDPGQRCKIGEEGMEAPGRIREFHAYNLQDGDSHASADSLRAFMLHLQEEADVVRVGELLLHAYESQEQWANVEPFFQCAFALSSDARPASAGEAFRSSRGH
ncbi:MAG: hypothetical protein KDI71_18300 [Xanthomonadales bacterium]|nr:hypothetical protein [Xanthomonadales bacterium]